MIELKHVSKVFETAGGRVEALKDISLTIPDGDVYGIIGMSGAGKIAIDYGYYRYKDLVMYAAVILLILLVQLFQSVGTKLAAKCDKRLKNR